MTRVSLLASLGLVLMLTLEIPLFSPFLKLDLGLIPVLIAAFALGPWKGVATALLKAALFLVLRPTPETWVGAPMNFFACGSFAFVAGSVYWQHKTKRQAVLSLLAGTVASTVFMMAVNFAILPAFLDAFLGMRLTRPELWAYVLTVVTPFNLANGAINGVLTFVVYKRISPVLKAAGWDLPTPVPTPAPSQATSRIA